MNWEELTAKKEWMETAGKLGFSKPTPVQERTWQSVLAGKDLCVRAETGSGKTMAYLMPLMERYRDCGRENKVLILVPTHELAMQVFRQARLLAETAVSYRYGRSGRGTDPQKKNSCSFDSYTCSG